MRTLILLCYLASASLSFSQTTVTAIGDSLTFGNYGFDDDKQVSPLIPYPTQLSALLSLPVTNTGVGGWSSGRVRGEWHRTASQEQKAGIVIMGAGTNNKDAADSSLIVADFQAVLDSLTSNPKTFIILLQPHSGTEFTAAQKANIINHHAALKAAFPEYAIDMWDHHVDAEGLIETDFRRYNPDGKRDSLHPNNRWSGEVARRVYERILARGWAPKSA